MKLIKKEKKQEKEIRTKIRNIYVAFEKKLKRKK